MGRLIVMNETMVQTLAQVREALRGHPRVRLAELPTPLSDCPRLSAELGGPHIYIKRDDLTGLAFGGNKVRQHEYVLGAAIAQGADCFVQGAAAQSNHSRQLAAAGARLGVETFLLPKLDARSLPVQGNFLVDHLLGAAILPIEADQSSIQAKAALVERLRAEGRNPYITGMGSDEALALAALAYVEGLFEIIEQLPPGTTPSAIYTASQGSTQVGLLIAREILGLDVEIIGISPLGRDHEASIPTDDIVSMAQTVAGMLGTVTELSSGDIELRDEFVGDGYGIPTDAGLEAIALLGRTEGILLDPVYTGKAFSGLASDVRGGRFGTEDTVVFLHTGGLPALFAYAEPVLAHLDSNGSITHQSTERK